MAWTADLIRARGLCCFSGATNTVTDAGTG
jgi:hypothetical protein